jgi:hypothetical protein
MVHYFLHQRGGVREFTDEEGQELASLDDARRSAIEGIRSILADEIIQGRFNLGERIDICDSTGTALMSVSFAEALDQRI